MNVDQRISAARHKDLVTTESGDEILIYDLTSNQIHHLNSTVAAVWNLCDGQRTVTDISVTTGMTEDLVTLAVARLGAADLLRGKVHQSLRDTSSRRSFLRRSATLGAASVPAIVSVTAPTAALATSPGSGSCVNHDTRGRCPESGAGNPCCNNLGWSGPNAETHGFCDFRHYENCQGGYGAEFCDPVYACF